MEQELKDVNVVWDVGGLISRILHGATSQKIVMFVTDAVRISNLIYERKENNTVL
jgi:hypothetical protein